MQAFSLLCSWNRSDRQCELSSFCWDSCNYLTDRISFVQSSLSSCNRIWLAKNKKIRRLHCFVIAIFKPKALFSLKKSYHWCTFLWMFIKNGKEIKMLGNPDRHSFANKARRIRREEIRRIHDQRHSIIPRIPTRHDWKKTSQMAVKCMLLCEYTWRAPRSNTWQWTRNSVIQKF